MLAFSFRAHLGPALAGLVALSAFAACSNGDDAGGGGTTAAGGAAAGGAAAGGAGSGGAMPQAVEPSAATKAIWADLQGYGSWPTFAENPTPKASQSHMKAYVLAHYNDVVAAAIAGKTLPLPDGAIIVKDNFMSPTDAQPMAVTVMAKQAGSWYWIEAMPNGMVMVDTTGQPLEGNVAMCTGCHDGAKANDDVLTHDFTK